MPDEPAPAAARADVSTPTKRARFQPRHRPYWAEVARGVHLGYRKADAEKAGVWYGRAFVSALSRYEQWKLGAADDRGATANGTSVLTHRQATDKLLRGRPHAVAIPRDSAAYTVEHAVREYIEHLKTEGKSANDAEARLEAYVIRKLGSTPLAHLTHDDLSGWRKWALAYKPPGRRDWPKYLRRSASMQELQARQREAREHLGKQLPAGVIGAYERRGRELQGLVKVRKHGPAPTRPRPAPKVEDPAETDRKRKETLNRLINYVKAALNLAHANGRVSSTEAWDRLQRWKGTGAARIRWLTLEEVARLLNASDPAWRPAIEVGLATGARWSEVRRSQVMDYDRASGTLLIPKAKSRKPRHIPLNDEGKALLDRLTAGRSRAAYIVAEDDKKPWGSRDQSRPMREASSNARLDPPAGFHALRHTYASHLVQAGTPLLFVARALGHSDTRMVEKHYGHLAPDTVADSVRANLPNFGLTTEPNIRRLRP